MAKLTMFVLVAFVILSAHTPANGEVTHTQPNGESVHTLHSQPPHARSYSSSMPNKRTPIAAAKITMRIPLERNTKDPADGDYSDDDMPATLRRCGNGAPSGPSCFCNGTVLVDCSAIPSSETGLDLSGLGITSLLPGVFSNMSALSWL